MKFSIPASEQSIFLTRAILLYEKNSAINSSPTTVFASLHDVGECGTKARPNRQIMPGTGLTKEALLAIFNALSKQNQQSDIIPEHLLSVSPFHMLWWRPASLERIFMKCKELGSRTAIVPHPPLLFYVSSNNWQIFALKDSKRPTKETRLFHAPYFNVYDDAKICCGSANVPDVIDYANLPLYEKAFFESEFTHINGSTKKISHPRGEYAFWKEMLDGTYKTFPEELLVPHETSVCTLLAGIKELGVTHG